MYTKTIIPILSIFLLLAINNKGMAQSTIDKQQIIQEIDKELENYGKIAHEIWGLAELGFLEDKSTQILQDHLKKEGFTIKTGVAGMPTAFVAEYGTGKPIIGLLAEYDALPDMSQAASPTKGANDKQEVTAGHACGHHLFGTGSMAAAIHIKNWLKKTGTTGTIRLYGTPAEEGGGGKVYMVRAGLFDDADAVLSWHPGDENNADAGSSLAAISIRFRFKGIAAHAAGAPWRGRSALDGVEAMNYMVNMMREHITPDSRIHYAILNGAKAPNIVPAFAEVAYIIRHPDMRECKAMIDRVILAANAAAMGTETEVSHEVITGYFNKLPNKTLAEVMHANLEIVGGVNYTETERQFATEIMTSYDTKGKTPETAQKVKPLEVITKGMGGSTDVGDISWVRPTTGMRSATWVPGTVAHSWQAVAAGGTTIGHKGMMVAAKTLTLTALDLYQQPDKLIKAEAELLERRGGDFKYEALLGDRKPPLEYRKGAE
ncbi:MAG: amidohydrolase [Saprospiraceae bacterium]